MPSDHLVQCRFPALAEPYHSALRAAVTLILDRFDPLGIIASGTIVRGHPGPNSDLDIYVIHAAPWRQRLQVRFNGVPAEIFVNPLAAVQHYFVEERHSGRPITAHMLATGAVILDRDPVVEQVREQARVLLCTPPDPMPDQLRFSRYMIGSSYEDARDTAATDPLSAGMILAGAVHEMLRYSFLAANRYIPREKDLLAALDPDLAALAREFYGAGEIGARLALAQQIADRTIQTDGFFEWESEPDEVRP